MSIGYHASKADSSIFILHTPTTTSYILLYVDDIILTASSTNLLDSIINKMQSEFAMKDLEPFSHSHFLGIHLTPSSSGIFLSQEHYVNDLLDYAHMLNCNPSTTPINTKPKLSSTDGRSVSNATEFRSFAGALQ